MSSPQINNLILAGSILCYISVLLMGIDSTLLGRESSESSMNFICAVRFSIEFPIFSSSKGKSSVFLLQARVWTLSIGFTISFGAIFSKAWRVKKLFTMRNASKRVFFLFFRRKSKRNERKIFLSDFQAVKDSQLFLIVGILFLIDSALLLSWQFVDPLKIFKNISEREVRSDVFHQKKNIEKSSKLFVRKEISLRDRRSFSLQFFEDLRFREKHESQNVRFDER